MGKFRFAAGVKVRINNVPHRFVTRVDGGWQLVALSNNLLSSRTDLELERLYADGHLVLDLDQVDESPERRKARQRRQKTVVSDLTPKQRSRLTFRRAVLREVAARTTEGTKLSKVTVDGKETTVLAKVLADISREHGRATPVSVATYYRWLGRYGAAEDSRDLLGEFSNRGRKQLHPTVRRILVTTMAEALRGARDKNRTGAAPVVTIKAIKTACEGEIARAREADPSIPAKYPSRATYYNYWKEFPAYDRTVARHGVTRARMLFRAVRGHDGPEAVLDLVEYDETELPYFFFDEDTGVPLGRGWLNWYIDVFAHMPLGFYLGFEPPSDLTIASALRHACLPKAYVKDEYPGIHNRWLGAGIPRLLLFDNGLAQHGTTIEDITDNLDTFYKFTRVRTPWFKATVEGTFNLLNQTLLREMPGFVLGKSIDPKDYDPTKNGCIGLRHFLYILHKWLCDVYCETPQGELGWTPNARWREGTAIHEPEFLACAADLNLIFGITREAALDHRGVVYETLRYYSDALHAFRQRRGHRMKVRVKVNPNDMEFVHVWEPKEKCWVPVQANRGDYAKGLTLHRHKLNLRHAREHYGREDPDALRRAQQELQAMIANALPMALGIRANELIARMIGVGTQHIFDHLDHDGRLGALSGPFTGQRLNPFAAAPTHAPSGPEPTTHDHRPEAGGPPTALSGDRDEPAATPANGNRPATARRKRDIPVFAADRSLAKD